MPALSGWALAAVALSVTFALDQVTKAIVVASVARSDTDPIFPGVDLTYVRNEGVAFGAFEDGGALIWVFTGLALGILIGYFALNAGRPYLWLPVGMLLGGALGNLADRARDGSVIDFIDPIAWPAFNLADTAIVLGLLGVFYVAEGNE